MSGPAYSAGLIGKDVAPTAVVKCHSHHRPRSEGKSEEEEEEERRWARSNSLGPLHQSQVGQEGVFVGGGRGGRAGGGRRVGGEEERRCGGPPSGVEVRVECEAAVVGEQGGEGDQVRPVAAPVLLEHVAGGGEEEGGAAAARAAGVSGGVVAVRADHAVQRAAGVQLVGLAQCE